MSVSLRSRPSTNMITREAIGVVLCGGESSRMGRDKGLIAEKGLTWAERAANLLAPHVQSVVFSVRDSQVAAYQQAIESAECVIDSQVDSGPLGGLISVHKVFPDAHLLLLACDMTAVTAADFLPLLAAKGEIVAYRHGDLFEPLCARYSPAACREILRRSRTSAGRLPGLQRLLHELHVTALTPQDSKNLESRNTPEP